jgi:hypothetical protein
MDALNEGVSSSKQCRLEGFVCNGQVDSHGIVDSYRHPNRVSFSRYQYPSRLSRAVQDRVFDASSQIMTHLGFDNSGFNIEYFYDRRQDKLWLVEINPRIAQSHSDLFKKLDSAMERPFSYFSNQGHPSPQ